MKIQWIEHEFGPSKPRIRIKQEDWADDCFEIISWEAFEIFRHVAEKLGIEVKRIIS